MFSEKALHGFSPNSYIHVSVSNLYIPRIVSHIWEQNSSKTDRPILEIYKSLTDICMYDLGDRTLYCYSVLDITRLQRFISGNQVFILDSVLLRYAIVGEGGGVYYKEG